MNRRNWAEVHRLESKQRAAFLKRLPAEQGFKILQDMYELAHSVKGYGRKQASMFHEEKIKILAKVHAVFNKVKS